MYAVIFEVEPKAGRMQDYLDTAARLRPEVERSDGFLSVERFQSIGNPSKLVSLSFYRDERAVQAWRENPLHREAQARGRADIFQDYRIRVAEVRRDYGMLTRDQVPAGRK
jgi:heme-degrading monooxygenase HmoA